MLVVRNAETARGSIGPRERGVSQEAQQLTERVLDVLRSLKTTNHHLAMGELIDAFDGCHRRAAEGEEVEPVRADTFARARALLLSLPNAFPAPEIAAEEDGSIVFDWLREQNRLLSVTLTPKGRLIYAGVFEDRSVRGIEPFEGELPEPILSSLRRLYKGDDG